MAFAQELPCIKAVAAALGLYQQYGEVLVGQGINPQAIILMFQNPVTTSFSIIAIDTKGCARMILGGEAWEAIHNHPPVKETPT